MKAIGCMIFTGSATLGVLKNNINVDRVLEISDEIVEQNAKHFIHNYPNIPVIIPSEWENKEYLEKLKLEEYDLMYGNPPCSGLSQINKNAKADNEVNKHIIRYFNTVNAIMPKTFILENAPTLLKIGKPLLNEMVKILPNYNFTLIRDFGRNHGVPMRRQRTFVVGWRKDIFKEIPVIKRRKYSVNVEDTIGDLINEKIGESKIPNFELVPYRTCQSIEHIIKDIPVGRSINLHICENYEKYEDELPEAFKKSLSTMLYKYRNNKRFWDKSPARIDMKGTFPSMASVVELIHPVLDRQLTIREYARIMGYPDTFEFVECETPIIQCISQGVPVNYFAWISGEVKNALENYPEIKTIPAEIVYQHHISMKAQTFTKEEFLQKEDITFLIKEKLFNLEEE